MAELTVLLVRHAESLGNLSGQFQGQTDTPLSSKGRRQAERLAARLADQPIQAVYTSDMSRAHETARPIAERTGAPLIAKQELREIDVGKWSGLTFEEITSRFPEEAAAWHAGDPHFRRGGGESYVDAQQRMVAGMEEIVAAHSDGQIVVVSHGAVLRALLAHVLGFPINGLYRLQIANASWTLIAWDGEHWFVRHINDTCHLDHETGS